LLAVNREAADSRIFPTRGTVSNLRIEWGLPGAVSDNHFILGEASGSLYLELPGGIVLAAKLAVGAGAPTGESTVLLPNKRFYSGGSSSMRGFKRRQLGPVDSEGTPIGGEAKLEAAAELRYPILWRIKGALFLDTGQAWRHREDMNVNDLEAAAGAGLMVLTPVGPIRLDIAKRVTDKIPDQPKTVLHVSIGHPF
jgi:outer membrane protein assembly factor BamA